VARVTLTERVNELEQMMMRLVYVHLDTEMAIQSLKKEMEQWREKSDKDLAAFKEEMKRWREKSDKDMAAFKEEMRQWREKSDKDMAAFKEEMRQWREEMEKDRREMNKRWGELANKMGTLVEDIVAPAFPDVIKERFNTDILRLMMYTKARHPQDKHKTREFDLIAVCEDRVFWCEVKSTPRMDYAKEFVELLKKKELYEYFPEYSDKSLVGVFASLNVPEDVVKYLSKHGVYAMGMKGEYMDILNFDDVKP